MSESASNNFTTYLGLTSRRLGLLCLFEATLVLNLLDPLRIARPLMVCYPPSMIHPFTNITLDVRVTSGAGVVHRETVRVVQQVIYRVVDVQRTVGLSRCYSNVTTMATQF
jgi:hypothetical protein